MAWPITSKLRPMSKAYFWTNYLLVLISILFLGYYTPRNNFPQLITTYSLAFMPYAALIYGMFKYQLPYKGWQLILLALGIRLLLVFLIPNLSDDYFRFIWDGRLWTNGVHPFAHYPKDLLEDPLFQKLGLKDLYFGDSEQNWTYFEGLNSKEYYSVYPTVNQLIFGISAWLSPKSIWGSIVIMRLIFILAEFGTLYFSLRILKALKLPERQFIYYAFNPLIIIEITANLHFEGIALFFFVTAIYFLIRKKQAFVPHLLAAAVATKLIPLLSFPIFWSYWGWKKGFKYMLLSGISILLLLSPLFYNWSYFQHFLESIGLYFGTFEFNSSFYYFFKWLAGFIWDYPPKNRIAMLLSLSVAAIISYLSIFKRPKNTQTLFLYLLIGFSLYLFSTRTVNPWYLTFIIWLSTFTKFSYPILWSYLILWSYYGLSTPDYSESYLIIIGEYIILFVFMFFEYFRWRSHAPSVIPRETLD
jgi:alpha-1,6-mannosyltransferase